MSPLPTKNLLAFLLAGSMLGAACTSAEPSASEAADRSVSSTVPEASTDGGMSDLDTAMPATDDGASTLRAGLTSLLQEHLYLAAITIETAVDAGGDLEAPAVIAASGTLDQNSVALADAVSSVAGAENGEAFLGLWREHIGFFVDYTLGRATGDQATVDQAIEDLNGYKLASAAFFEDITGGAVTAAQVEQVLAPHATTTFAAIDALVAGRTDAFTLVRAAGQEMPRIATALATAIVAAQPEQFPGAVTSAPAETRAVLTYLLQEHVYLAGIALEQAVEASGDLEAPAVVAAVGALDENSVALSEIVAAVAGAENGEAFLGLWREHIGFFVDYTLGRATGEQAAVDLAITNLEGYKEAAGAFFEDITGGELSADAFVDSLDGHTSTLFATIDLLVAGDPGVFDALRTAAQHMPMSANAIATAVAAAGA